MPLQTIQYRGKTLRFRNINTLSRRLNITRTQAINLIADNNPTRYIISSTGNLQRVDIKDELLLSRDFDIKRIQNKRLLRSEYKIKNNLITDNIPQDKKLNLIFKIEFAFEYGGEINGNERTFTIRQTTTLEELNDTIHDSIQTYMFNGGMFNFDYNIRNVEIRSSFSKQVFELKDSKLRDIKPLRIFNQQIDNTQYHDCVRDYFKKIYPKISKKKIDKLGDENGVSTNEIIEFCKKYRILCIAYDISRNVIAKYTPEKRNKSYKSLFYIAHNNHLYPIKNKQLTKLSKSNTTIELVPNIDNKIRECLLNGIEPQNVILNKNGKSEFKCFDIKDKTYLQDDDYSICLNILKKFGIDEKMNKHTSLNNITEIIHKFYKPSDFNIDSFFPNGSKFIKSGMNYNVYDKKIHCDDEIITIDKNKCYSYCLSNLPFLIQLDTRQSKIRKFKKGDKVKLIPHHLYIIKVNKSTILLNDNNIYSGFHLIYCLEQNLKFDVKQEITTNKVDNYFKPMINDIYDKVDSKYAKTMMNVFIGKFENCQELYNTTYVDRICNKEESKTIEGYKIPIKYTDYYLVEKEYPNFNITNRKPIAIQIKDYSRIVLYEKMKELKLKACDLIKLKTDSISFKKQNYYLQNLDKNDYTKWKMEKFKPQQYKVNITNNSKLNLKFNKNNYLTDSIFVNCYAGTGKSYYIMNTLIP